jgi:hypothetical protein
MPHLLSKLRKRQSFGHCDRYCSGTVAANAEAGYRFLFLPATIGATTWLARNEARLNRINTWPGSEVFRR